MTYTNTALSTARRCLRQYELRYDQQLERDGFDSEALQVGQAWHKAHDVRAKGGNPYDAISKHAPGAKWNEKLRRLFAAHVGYWQDQPFEVIESERKFCITHKGVTYEGQLDGDVKLSDGRTCLLERKTSGEDISAGAPYWDRLRLDTQVGIYALALPQRPSLILYDVVRKPTINPKAIAKADILRLRKDLKKLGAANYYNEVFTAEQLEWSLVNRRESLELYGARLTADIGDRPEFYFQRRPVPRLSADYESLLSDLDSQVQVIEQARSVGSFYRNPDQCNAFGRCDFFELCTNNLHPRAGEQPPEGFHRREHLHPELQ